MAELRDLFISKARAKLLMAFFSQPKEIFYVRELTRMTGEEINAVRRELAHMEARGMVKKEPRANRLYYKFRLDYLFYFDLLSLVAKTTGLGKEIIKNKNKIGRVKLAVLSSNFMLHGPHKSSDVDLLIVGEIVLVQLAAIVKEAENKLKREINYTVMNKEEFQFRKKRQDPFIINILLKNRIMLIGNEQSLISVIG